MVQIERVRSDALLLVVFAVCPAVLLVVLFGSDDPLLLAVWWFGCLTGPLVALAAVTVRPSAELLTIGSILGWLGVIALLPFWGGGLLLAPGAICLTIAATLSPRRPGEYERVSNS